MDKMTKIVSYLPELAFVALTVRATVYGAGFGDALAIVSLVTFVAYNKWLSREKIEDMTEINKKIEELSNQIQSLKLDKSIKRATNEPQAQRRIF